MSRDLCGPQLTSAIYYRSALSPYVSLIVYDEIVYDESASDNKVNAWLMDQKSELLTVLTCCQHGLDLGISCSMSGINEPSMSRLYSSWIVFLAYMFNCIDLKPAPGFLQSMMPKIFIETGHHFTYQFRRLYGI